MELKRDIDLQCKLIENMNEIVCNMNNEYAYDLWILTFPDDADEEEIREIAEDEAMFDDVVDAFFKVCKIYGKDGLCTYTI